MVSFIGVLRVLFSTKSLVILEFIIGVILGYICVKLIKYTLVFIVLLLLGVIFSILPLSSETYILLRKLIELVIAVVAVLVALSNILSLCSLLAGFLVGVLVALIK
jgi:hypothetical protein